MTSLPAAIEALGSPSERHPESNLATNLYSDSTPIANMDEPDHRINFNLSTNPRSRSQWRSGHQALLLDPV
jgi:hypothetical protein